MSTDADTVIGNARDWCAAFDARQAPFRGDARELLLALADRLAAAEARAALLDDDEAVMRGITATRRLLMLRIGDLHQHAEAFRAALAADMSTEAPR